MSLREPFPCDETSGKAEVPGGTSERQGRPGKAVEKVSGVRTPRGVLDELMVLVRPLLEDEYVRGHNEGWRAGYKMGVAAGYTACWGSYNEWEDSSPF